MKEIMFVILLFGFSSYASTPEDVEVKITSLTNTRHNVAMEVCGTAVHQDGATPLWVTVTHEESKYSTLTAPSGDWCVLVKRWSFSGKVDVSARSLP